MDSVDQSGLIDELLAQQDAVIEQLDGLIEQIEAVLKSAVVQVGVGEAAPDADLSQESVARGQLKPFRVKAA
jgi:hypothetical protein